MACSLIKRLLRHREGIALIEFAMVFPLLFLLLFGGIEISRLVLIHQKLEKAGYVVADIVAQYDPTAISVSDMNNSVFPQFARMMSTYSKPDKQAVIVTSVRIGGPAYNRTLTIDWQLASGNPFCVGATCATSIVNGTAPGSYNPGVKGTSGFNTSDAAAVRTLLTGMPKATDTSDSDYTVIVNEVFYYYEPLLGSLLEDVGAASAGVGGYSFTLRPTLFVKRTYFVPRVNGKLFDLN
jgi:Flp pilus assembly protein TadG